MENQKQRPKLGRPKGSKNNKNPSKERRRKRTYRETEAYCRRRMANAKPVKTLQCIEFGKNREETNCYSASVITIKDEPYFGFIKCWRGSYTRQRLFMPMPAWMSFVHDVLPQMNCTPTHDRYLFCTYF